MCASGRRKAVRSSDMAVRNRRPVLTDLILDLTCPSHIYYPGPFVVCHTYIPTHIYKNSPIGHVTKPLRLDQSLWIKYVTVEVQAIHNIIKNLSFMVFLKNMQFYLLTQLLKILKFLLLDVSEDTPTNILQSNKVSVIRIRSWKRLPLIQWSKVQTGQTRKEDNMDDQRDLGFYGKTFH